MSDISSILISKYGITPSVILSVKGGWATKAAYRVTNIDGIDYFVKVYDRHLPTIRSITDRIEKYMPVLDWLATSTSLQGRILTPVRSIEKTYKINTEHDAYVIFLYVDGYVTGVDNTTEKQTIELAGILAQLHTISESIPFETHGLEEDLSLLFCDNLIEFLNNPETENKDLTALIGPHVSMLKAVAKEVLKIRDTKRIGYSPLVLCHGDAHGNNVIQSEKLVLADWDDLRWAPVEADLFISFLHKKHSNTFLEAYCKARNCYEINYKLLYFYKLRRHIEDIWVDIERIIKESPGETELSTLLIWISNGIKYIQELMIKPQK